MEKLENLGGVTQYLNDLRHVMDKAKEQPRQYNKQSNYQYKPTEARFKLVVWYKDGNRLDYKPVRMKPLTAETVPPKVRTF